MGWTRAITDEQAMWRVQTHADPAAFAELVKRWETPLRRLCARMTGDLHRAEDLTQEAFARLFTRRASYQADLRFSTWIWRITVNLCHDELRRRQRCPEQAFSGAETGDDGAEAEPPGPEPDPAAAAAGLEEAEMVRNAVSSLPERLRSVVALRHYEGLKFAEIAEVLGVPEGTVRSRMAEALERLAAKLQSTRPGAAR